MGLFVDSGRMNTAYAVHRDLKAVKKELKKGDSAELTAKVDKLKVDFGDATSIGLSLVERFVFTMTTGRSYSSMMKEAGGIDEKVQSVAQQTIGSASAQDKGPFAGQSVEDIVEMIKEQADQPTPSNRSNGGYVIATKTAALAAKYVYQNDRANFPKLLIAFKATVVKGMNGEPKQLFTKDDLGEVTHTGKTQRRDRLTRSIVADKDFPRGEEVLTSAEVAELEKAPDAKLPEMQEDDFAGKTPEEAVAMVNESMNPYHDMVTATKHFAARNDQRKSLRQFLALSMKTNKLYRRSDQSLFDIAEREISNLNLEEDIKAARLINNAKRDLGLN